MRAMETRATPAIDSPGYDLESWRREIPLAASMVLMNHCSQAPQCARTRAAAEAYLESWNRKGTAWDEWLDEVERSRAAFAAIVSAPPGEVAVSTSVSHATASVASALDFTGSRKRIVACDGEFPTVGHVWRSHERFGASIDWVPLRGGTTAVDDWESRIDDRTLLVSIPHGLYGTGARHDVAAIASIAKERGALVYVDAYQTAGTRPIDPRAMGADFLAAGTLKYLMGVPGIAYLWIRGEIVEQLEPAITGWFGRVDPFAFDARRLDWPAAGRRFDTGTPGVVNAYVARAGMEMLTEIGLSRIGAWTEALAARLIEGGLDRGFEIIGPDDPARRTPSTAFRCDGDSHDIEKTLRERGVIASARGPAIRLAPHFYSSFDDVDRALEALGEVFAAARR